MINTETRLGDFLDFGQLFKAFGSNSICPNLPHFLAIYAKVSKSIIFLVKSFLGNFDRHLAIFSDHTEFDPVTLLTMTRSHNHGGGLYLVEGEESSHPDNCQTNLAIVLV